MKHLLTFGLVLSLGACSLFQKKEDEKPGAKPGKPPREAGIWVPGPCTLKMPDGSEKRCGQSGKGGCCISDNACHSDQSKCKQ